MGRLTAALALVALGVASVLAQPAPAFPTQMLDKWFDTLHASHGFSGAAVIERNGAIVYARGVGLANAETGLAFTPATRTDGASLAKPFTAASLLMLVESGAVDMQAPVRRYVAEYPDATTKVESLLSHGAALPDYGAFRELLRAGKPVTTRALLEAAGRMSAQSPSTTARFAYCNLCLDTAALVVERVTGKRFDEVLRQQLLSPLGIDGAFIRPARLSAMPADRAIGYRIGEKKRERFDAEDFEGFYGGANLYASASDLARFARAFVMPSSTPGVKLPERALWALVPPGDLNAVLTLGNWYCTSYGVRCYYTGSHRGFYNVMYFDREKRLVVVYVSNSGIAPWLQPRITRELVVTAEGRLPAPLVERKLAPLTPDALRAAVGRYDVPGAGRVVLFLDQDQPYVRAGGGTGVEYRLHQVSPTLLYGPGLDAYVGVGDDGRLSWTTGFIESYGTRMAP